METQVANLPLWTRQHINCLTQHNDLMRTGANLHETLLHPHTVDKTHFGLLFRRPVDGQIYAQPLYLSQVQFLHGDIHNVVYVVTMHNTVYAFDADRPELDRPLWSVSLGPSVTLPDPNIGPPHFYHDIDGEIGSISTPVISLDHQVIYVVAITRHGNNPLNFAYAYHLHALDLYDGSERLGGPVSLSAQIGNTTFVPHLQMQRSALTLVNDTIYMAFAAFGDRDPYHGWVLGYNARTLKQVGVYNTTLSGERGGIWQAGQGLSVDEHGYLYFLTGNGTFKPDGSALGDSLVKLDPHLSLVDWFTPFNTDALNAADADLGSAGVLLLPGTPYALGGGKESKFYLVERNHLGKFNGHNNSQIVQEFYVCPPDDPHNPLTGNPNHTHHIHGGPIYWAGPGGPYVYVWAENDYLKAYRFTGKRFDPQPATTYKLDVPVRGGSPGMPGGILSLSAHFQQAGSGIVWATHPLHESANFKTVDGIVYAFNAQDLSRPLWTSEQNPDRDRVGKFAKFCPPTIANGKVYVATFSGSLAVYGLPG